MSAGQRAARRAVGVLVVALFAWWAVADGGYAPGAWYPGALMLLVAIAGCVRPRMLRDVPPGARLALAALAGFTAWTFCSIAWADARGDAWDGANRTLLYLMVFALFAVVPWTVAEAAAGLGAFALATAGVGAWEIGRVVVAGADASVFVDGRLAGPVGYENASAALFLVAFWPALLLAAHPLAPGWARAIMLATAGLLLELTVLAQSRGALVAGVVTLTLAVLLVRNRILLLASLLAVGAVTAASLPTLLGVYEAAPREPDLGPVAIALGLSAAVLVATGLVLGRVAGGRGRLVRGVAAAAVVLTTAGAALAIAAGTPADSRLAAGLGSGRYDFWRVATLEFVRHPLGGVGADNFAHDYVRERRRREEPLYPHSLALRAVTQLGAVGGALLALFVGAVVVAVRRLPSGDLGRSAVSVAAFVAGAVWLVHGSIDWLWEMPAVAAPAMACLGLAAGLGPRAPEVRAGASTVARAGAAIVACAAGLSLALPALSAREVEGAVRAWRSDPGGALRRLERARELNPLTDRPDLVAGAVARRAGDRERARRAFLAALGRDDRNWHAHVEVALLDLQDGRRPAALVRLRRAHELNPREPVIGVAIRATARGQQPSRALLDRLSELAIPRPIGRGPVDCRPVLGLGSSCVRETVP
jgi:hypothetical protein